MSNLKDTIRDLKARADEARRNASKLSAAVDALQATCDHDWTHTGYDPRGGGCDSYRCDNCGLEKTE